jgi:error-prone DNA polymerase
MSFRTLEKAPIDDMTDREELITSYLIQGFSPSSHLLSLYRVTLTQWNAISSATIGQSPSGSKIITAGYNVCIQAPPTAKGFAFVTLEDEEGLMNIVMKPDVFKAHRVIVRCEPLLLVEGIVEKKDGVINVIAHKVSPLRTLLK